MPRRFQYAGKFTIRLTLAERRQLGARAAAAGLSLSRYLVEAGLADRVSTPRDRAQRDRALFHLRKVGVNLNQIARRLNGQQAVPPATVEAALRAARQALEQVGETV
jgi:hypothetical protein